MKYVVTHSGKAHRDDFYAVGLAAYLFGVLRVFRRKPTSEELEDPEVLVIDVGLRHEPEKSNFDHHQLPAGVKECALSLMAKHYTTEMNGNTISYHDLWYDAPWYVGVVIQDSLGPPGLARWLGIGDRIPEELNSGIEIFCLQRFAGQGEVPREWVEFALDVVKAKVDTAKEYKNRQAEIARKYEMKTIEGIGQVFWAPQLTPFGLKKFMESQGIEVCASVTIEPRGGVCIYRLDERLDFSGLAGEEDVEFAHKGGFMVNLKAGTPWERVEDLIKIAARKGGMCTNSR